MSRRQVLTEVRCAVRSTEPAVDVPRLATVIGSFDATGQVIDGADVGAPGWIFARTLGEATTSTIMTFDRDTGTYDFDLSWTDLNDALVSAFDEHAQTGERIEAGETTVHPGGMFALGGRYASVLVGPLGDYMFRAVAAGIGANLIAAPLRDHVVLTREAPAPEAELVDDLSGGLLGAATAFGRKAGLVLWRRGNVTASMLVVKGDVVESRIWEPAWTTIEPRSMYSHDLAEWVGDVVDDLSFDAPDGAAFAKAYSLDADRLMRLRSVLRRDKPDVAELLTTLGLPAEVNDIFEGRTTVSELGGSTTFQASSATSAILAEMRGPQKLGLPDGSGPARSRWRRR